MKSPGLPIGVGALMVLTSCIADTSWLGIVGRWQDVEAPAMELEFTSSGRFNEYFLGELVGYGEFYAQGNDITLHYQSSCGADGQTSCDYTLGFTVTEETLIITDAEGDIRFRRSDISQ